MLSRSSPNASLIVAVVGLAYWAAAASSLWLTGGVDGVASVWPASGILLAAMVCTRGRVRIGCLIAASLASLFANAVAGMTAGVSIGFTFANGLEALVGGWIWARLARGRRSLSSWRDVTSLMIAVAGAGATSALIAGVTIGAPSPLFVTSWFCTVTLGMLVVTPVAMTDDRFLDGGAAGTSRRSRAAWLAGLLAVTVGSFAQSGYPLLFLPLAALLAVTWHLGVRGAAVGLLVISLVGSLYTEMNRGPIALIEDGVEMRSLFFQAYLMTLFATALPIAVLNAARARLAGRLKEALQAAETAASQSLELADRDHLTGIASRRRIMADLGRALDEAREGGGPLSIVVLDIDHFKAINDRYGHGAGDAVLAGFAAAVEGGIRPADRFGRIGGEEFLLITRQDDQGAAALAQRLRERVMRLPAVTDGPAMVTASFGVASHRPGDDVAGLLHRADNALYVAKAAGRDTVRIAS